MPKDSNKYSGFSKKAIWLASMNTFCGSRQQLVAQTAPWFLFLSF